MDVGTTIDRCLAFVDGEPCDGTLTRTDIGPREQNRCDGVGHHAEPLARSPKKGRCEFCGKAIVLTREGRLRFHEKKVTA